ncbi:hypothetical protein ABT56_17920 [Photobacterium aquae]|uniref:PcfJ-like protein n=1 Tax=Photobacterium aquae TaxID=1195763 RepID=A0A0J1GVI4_9GAMM|nr:PcfJ domain-containing protein [Photobacterium aquae]KLV03693.1 hypothetical protein ABT56_17920 [Photobacterium aquae]
MSTMITIPTTMLGFNYDIELDNWHNKLSGCRVYQSGEQEPLDGGLGLGLDLLCGSQEGQQWLSTIPADLLAITDVFPEYQYQMLWLAVNSSSARQILECRPLLLVLICDKYNVDNEKALEVANLGQREILSHLGFDSSKSALKFIDKLDLTYQRSSELPHVIKQLDSAFSRFKVFKHYHRVNYSALALDHTHPFLTGTRLGMAIAHSTRRERRNLVTYLSDTLALGLAIGGVDPVLRVERLHSVEQLIVLHDQWVAVQLERRFEAMKPKDTDKPYPVCLPNAEGIRQIVDYDDLCLEAKQQRHCIAVYHNRIAAGHYAAYRMESPERMTIGIFINRKKAFPYEISQIAGFMNAIPSEKTRQRVHAWFEECKQQGL